MEEKIKDLNMLLMFLTGWEEDSRKNPGEKIFWTWKGYSFKIMNQLADEKMIIQFKDKKLVILTELGKQLAEKLKTKYLS
jgi:predicted transcriptional regulator